MTDQVPKRRWAMLLAATALVSSAFGDAATRPNVLLITVDTLRADHLHSYGFPLATSPSIDRLAAQGILFERAISASGYTGPSHASMMTSKYPRHHSMGYTNGQRKLSGERTLAEIFRQDGYATAAFVSNDVLGRKSGLDLGFQTYNDELPQAEINRPATFERTAEQTTKAALAWVESARSGSFFLWVHYQDPHGPYTPPPPYRDEFQLPAEGQPELRVLDDESGFGGVPHYQRLQGVRRQADYERLYAGEIAYADHWIGVLLSRAEQLSESGGLIVLLTADHGESFGEGGVYLAHGTSTSPELSHVPLILRLPGHGGERRRELVSHVDVMPTLLEAAGLPIPEGVEGLPLTRWLRQGANLPERVLYCDIGYELGAYRNGEFIRASFASSKSWDLAMSYQSGGATPVKLTDMKGMDTFRWDGGPTWSLTTADTRLQDGVRAYISTDAARSGATASGH